MKDHLAGCAAAGMLSPGFFWPTATAGFFCGVLEPMFCGIDPPEALGTCIDGCDVCNGCVDPGTPVTPLATGKLPLAGPNVGAVLGVVGTAT
jgi:hypothetical protein